MRTRFFGAAAEVFQAVLAHREKADIELHRSKVLTNLEVILEVFTLPSRRPTMNSFITALEG